MIRTVPIARQRVAKHIPAEANTRDNRTFIGRQRCGEKKNFVNDTGCVFPWGPCKVVVRESNSEVGTSGVVGELKEENENGASSLQYIDCEVL
jgi:hypothetical protein